MYINVEVSSNSAPKQLTKTPPIRQLPRLTAAFGVAELLRAQG